MINAFINTMYSSEPTTERWSGLYPMSEAHKDGNPILLFLVDRIPGNREIDRKWDGQVFVGLHHPLPPDGYDGGWMFAAPVGFGGFPDKWFKGWMPLPQAGRKFG